MEEFDVIIIGVGQAGNPLSTAFTDAGKKIAIIEEKFVGGTCINWGCTPTKTMAASAERLKLTQKSSDLGVNSSSVEIDLLKVVHRKNEIVRNFRDGISARIEKSDAQLIYGKASFVAPKTIAISLKEGGNKTIKGDLIVIDCGSKPRIPDLIGLEEINFLDSTTIMNLKAVPKHLLILGGGYISLEFAQMFRRFGSQVDIIEERAQLMIHEDEDVAHAVQQILEGEGISIWLNANAKKVSKNISNDLDLEIQIGKKKKVLQGSHLLIATGRMPNTKALNLSAAGIECDNHGYIKVNEKLETNIKGVYAAGDIKGGPAFTHIAYDDFRVLKANLIDGGNKTIANRIVPYVLFIDPQLGRIGLTEKEAREKKLDVNEVKLPMENVARAIEVGRTHGFLKALIDKQSGQILGAACLGVDGGEIMSMIEIAMVGKLPYTALRDGIFAHPTLAEALNNLFAQA